MLLEKENTGNRSPEKNHLSKSEKLPYVKPELHLLNLDGTEGKNLPNPSFELTTKITTITPSTFKSGPS